MRTRLLAGFLICAAVTLISAGMGTAALAHLRGVMRRTNGEVSSNIERYGARGRRLATLRGFIGRIHDSRDEEELESVRSGARSLLAASPTERDGLLEKHVEALLEEKRRMLDASNRLVFLRESCEQSLAIVQNAALDTVEEVEAEATLTQSEVRDAVRKSLEGREGGAPAVGPGGGKAERGASVGESLERLREATDQIVETLRSVFDVRGYSQELSAWVREIRLAGDDIEVETAHALLVASLRRLKTELIELPGAAGKPRAFASLDELERVIDAMAQAKKDFLAAEESLAASEVRMEAHFRELDRASAREAEDLKLKTAAILEGSTELAGRLQVIQLLLGIAAMVLASSVALAVARSIARPIHEVIRELLVGAEHTSTIAEQVASGSASLAEMASEEAAALLKTSATMQEISAMTTQNAASAEQAERLMAEALDQVAAGKQLMARLSAAIEEVRHSSADSARVIQTINDFAFQTNLLALNAAVEAARAGEAGRGFSVVAEEVRRLAQQSAEAAQSTDSLIRDSVQAAEKVVSFAGETAASLRSIHDGTGRVGVLLHDMSQASREQSQSLREVSGSVDQVSAITQRNAASTQQSAAAARDLSARAERLMEIASKLEALAAGSEQS